MRESDGRAGKAVDVLFDASCRGGSRCARKVYSARINSVSALMRHWPALLLFARPASLYRGRESERKRGADECDGLAGRAPRATGPAAGRVGSPCFGKRAGRKKKLRRPNVNIRAARPGRRIDDPGTTAGASRGPAALGDRSGRRRRLIDGASSSSTTRRRRPSRRRQTVARSAGEHRRYRRAASHAPTHLPTLAHGVVHHC